MASPTVRRKAPSLRAAGFLASLSLLTCVSSCAGGGPLARLAPKRSAHETYAESLRDAGLDRAALGRAWLDAAASSLVAPQAVTLPLRETGYLDPARPAAIAYRFELRRGRQLAVNVTLESSEPAQLFLDLFRVTGDGPDRVATADPGAIALAYVSRADGAYILRLQPELLGGGRYTITQVTEASLRFPVQNADEGDIQSVFGDRRDAGAREHHGVDIFAPRGTPAVAAADGIIRSVTTTEIGGRVVWLYDTARRQSLYYAHLDNWAVRNGQQVRAGDVLGYMGNTGNARTTAPHLHFGIYSRGPVDPLPFIRASDRSPSAPTGSLTLLGEWARVARGPAALRPAPDGGSAPAATLPSATAVLVEAAVSSFFRVSLPDGREGFVDARAIRGASDPLRVMKLDADAPMRAHPSPGGIVIRHLNAGARIPVLAEFSGFMLVEAPDGGRGWLPRDGS